MLRTILLPTDGSECAEVAVRYGQWLACALNAATPYQTVIRLLYVQDIRITCGPVMPSGYLSIPGVAPLPAVGETVRLEELKSQGDAILAAAARRLAEHDIKHKAVNISGIVDEAILEESQCADLILMSRQGVHESFTHDALGSTTERVLRKTIKPVLVTPCEFREIKRILVAYDASDQATLALERACDLCSLLQLPMVLFTCREGANDHEPETRRQAERVRECCKFDLEVLIGEGHSEEEILQAGRSTGADLLVMGAYGHSRLRELILGSTTNYILLKSTLPVLLMR